MIRELVVISGKGGTGKTSITASFAHLAENKVMVDCDVDAADLHLVLNPRILSDEGFEAGRKAFIDHKICTGCGECVRLCRFDSIDENFRVGILACEGCGVCAHFCPEKAIEMRPHESGRWFVSDTDGGPFVHAKLGMAEGNSGILVSKLRKKAKEIAEEKGFELIVVDGSPGTGCPVIATVTGASFLLIVTEPTVSGIHDMKRALELAGHFRIKSAVCVNRGDINMERTAEIEKFCSSQNIEFFGIIPYDRDVTAAQMEGKSVVEYSTGPAALAIRDLWTKVKDAL